MKKRISVFLCALLLMSLLGLTGCNSDSNIFDYEVMEDGIHITGCTDQTSREELIVPDEIDGKKVVAIDDTGICNTRYVKKLVIGKNVNSIGTRAIINNSNLEVIEVARGNTSFKVVNGTLLTMDGKELVCNPIKNGVQEHIKVDDVSKKEIKEYFDEEYVIPEGVEIIRDYAFYHNQIKSVVFADSVERVGEYAFLRVGYLSQVKLSANLKFIGKDAFSKNPGLTELVIYEQIEEIEERAFHDCNQLRSLSIKKNKTDIILGEKWYPTDLGKNLKGLVIEYDDTKDVF